MNFKRAGLRKGCHKHIAHRCHAMEVSLVLPRTERFWSTLSFTSYLRPSFMTSKDFAAKFKADASGSL